MQGQTMPNREVGSEMQELYYKLTKEREVYSDLVKRLGEIGHKLHYTNYPTEPIHKEPSPDKQQEGLIIDIKIEVARISVLNGDLMQQVEKLSKLI